MKRNLVVLAALALLVTGCGAGLYSKQEYGPNTLTGQTLQDLISTNGCPDVVGGNGQMMVVGWYRTEGMHILGLFATVRKTAHGALIDAQGRVVARGSGEPGNSLTILGNITAPVTTVETK